MDTAAYLRKQGWRGTGHSLDSSNHGLKKPLLISKKIDVLGIGINKHDVVADQWWMKAFDASLKDFGTGKKSLLSQVRDHGIKRGGLYGRFVKGEGVAGTYGKPIIESDLTNLVVATPEGGLATVRVGEVAGVKSKKRKADDKEGKKQRIEDKEERRAAKKAKKAGLETDGETSTGDSKVMHKQKTSKQKEETLESLSEDKRQQYEERAKAKGVSLEEYFSRRQAKNLQASSESENPWAGRRTADLSEEERKARRKWLRQRRGDTGQSSGDVSGVTTPLEVETNTNSPNGEKIDEADSKLTSANTSSAEDETKSARKAAKKLLKEEKKEGKGKKAKKES